MANQLFLFEFNVVEHFIDNIDGILNQYNFWFENISKYSWQFNMNVTEVRLYLMRNIYVKGYSKGNDLRLYNIE